MTLTNIFICFCVIVNEITNGNIACLPKRAWKYFSNELELKVSCRIKSYRFR